MPNSFWGYYENSNLWLYCVEMAEETPTDEVLKTLVLQGDFAEGWYDEMEHPYFTFLVLSKEQALSYKIEIESPYVAVRHLTQREGRHYPVIIGEPDHDDGMYPKIHKMYLRFNSCKE